MTDLICIGIDPGASCGIAAVSRDWVAWTTVTLPSWRGYESPGDAFDDQQIAAEDALGEVTRMLERPWQPKYPVAIEDSRHAKGMQHAAMTGWHLCLFATMLGWPCHSPVVTVAPSTWQHGLVGAQGRDEYVRFARELTGGELSEKEHDAAAAICIAEWLWQREMAK